MIGFLFFLLFGFFQVLGYSQQQISTDQGLIFQTEGYFQKNWLNYQERLHQQLGYFPEQREKKFYSALVSLQGLYMGLEIDVSILSQNPCIDCSVKLNGLKNMKVKILPGTFHGQVLKYTNMGDQIEQGAPGDVYVRIVQATHPRFVRNGHNLWTEVSVSLKEALFGFTRTIKQLDGRQLTIEQKQITQPGQLLTIEGEGMPILNSDQKGNLIVKILGQSQRKGGISSISVNTIKLYVRYIYEIRSKLEKQEWLESIANFKQLVEQDPILRMNFQNGVLLSKQTLSGLSPDDIYDMLDTICKIPPAYQTAVLVGFPINSLFIEFMQNQNGRAFFSNEKVNSALKRILNDYGQMLQKPQSMLYLSTEPGLGWFSDQANSIIHNQWYKCDMNLPHYGYKSWDQWFLREFKQGMRPIGADSPEGILQDDIIVNSCQSSPLQIPLQPQFNVKITDNFWLKDDKYSLSDMFGGKKYQRQHYAKIFEGGTVYQAFLSALYYHRWHSPIDGIIEDIYGIDGTYYLDQSQFIPYDQGSPNYSQSFLTAVAARKVFLIKAKNTKIGRIAIIFVGMAEVSSCVETVRIGQEVRKGDQLGYFRFGGSSHAILFEKKANLKFVQTRKLYQANEKTGKVDPIKQNLLSYLAHLTD